METRHSFETTDKNGNDLTVTHLAVETQIEGFLLGKVLTIIDASYGNTDQREAIKSLVKEKFHSQMDWLLDRHLGKSEGEPNEENTTKIVQYEVAPSDNGEDWILPKEKLLSIIQLENAWDHVGYVKSEHTDAYELLLPLGKDHTLTMIVDSEAITDSGFFEKV